MTPARMTEPTWRYLQGRIRKQHSEGSLYLSGVGELLDECERARGREIELLEAAKELMSATAQKGPALDWDLYLDAIGSLTAAILKAEGRS